MVMVLRSVVRAMPPRRSAAREKVVRLGVVRKLAMPARVTLALHTAVRSRKLGGLRGEMVVRAVSDVRKVRQNMVREARTLRDAVISPVVRTPVRREALKGDLDAVALLVARRLDSVEVANSVAIRRSPDGVRLVVRRPS